MRVLFFYSAMMLLMACGNGKLTDCPRFHTGEFFMHTEFGTVQISRYKLIQVEVNVTYNDTSSMGITWFGPCEYELHSFHVRIPGDLTPKEEKEVIKFYSKPVRFQIIKTAPDYYITKGRREGEKEFIIDTLWVGYYKEVGGLKIHQ